MKSAIKMKKVIRSTKDNKAFYNLTKPLICDFLISLGGHNMRKMHAKAPYHKANEGLKVRHLGMSLIELLGSHPCELQNQLLRQNVIAYTIVYFTTFWATLKQKCLIALDFHVYPLSFQCKPTAILKVQSQFVSTKCSI